MARIIDLKTISTASGNLTVIEKVLPFDIKRVFYIYGVDDSVRGKHRHKKTIQAAVCIRGKCRITVQAGKGEPLEEFILDVPNKCLLIEPADWHYMDQFTPDVVLMVMTSEYYDHEDYIFTAYE